MSAPGRGRGRTRSAWIGMLAALAILGLFVLVGWALHLI